MIFVVACILLLCSSVSLYFMMFKLDSVYDKVLLFNNFLTHSVLLVTVMSNILDSFFLLDIALLYASVSFISSIALMKLTLLKNL